MPWGSSEEKEGARGAGRVREESWKFVEIKLRSKSCDSQVVVTLDGYKRKTALICASFLC